MYTIVIEDGTIVRNADNVVVAPCYSPEDPDFLEYVAWVKAGNDPAVVESLNP